MPPNKGFRSLHLASLLVFYSLVESTGPHVCVVHNTTATRAASPERRCSSFLHLDLRFRFGRAAAATPAFLQKGGVPAAPSGTATLLRLSPNHQFRPRPTLAVTDFRRPRLSWLDGRCVQGPGTYSPRHGRTCVRPARCAPHCNTCVAPDVRAVLI